MAATSPAPPIASLLKRESSVGEHSFDMQNTPNRNDNNHLGVTFGL